MGYGYGDMPDSPDIDVRMPDPHLTENAKRREDAAAAGDLRQTAGIPSLPDRAGKNDIE